MHTFHRFAVLLALGATLLPTASQAKALQTFHLMTLSAHNPKEALALPSSVALDPTLPVWMSYTVFAVSAQDKPTGDIVLGIEAPGLAPQASGSKVGFSTDSMTRLPADPNLTAQLTQQLGQHAPAKLRSILGPELHGAYQALQAGRGSVFGKTVVKTYAAPDSGVNLAVTPLRLSLEQAHQLQPALVIATLGQGEVPPAQQDYFSAYSADAERTELQLTGGLSVLIAGIYGFGRKRIRMNEEAEAAASAAAKTGTSNPQAPAFRNAAAV